MNTTTTLNSRQIRRLMARKPAAGQKGRQRRVVTEGTLKIVLRKRTDATRLRAAMDFVEGILVKPATKPAKASAKSKIESSPAPQR